MKKLSMFVRAYLKSMADYEANSQLYVDYDTMYPRTLADDWSDYLCECHYSTKKPLPYLVWLPVNWLNDKTYVWRIHAEIAYCETFGHNYEESGYAGPESGCIDVYCTRCGHGWHHQLY